MPDPLLVALPLRQVEHERKFLQRIFPNHDGTGEYGNAPAIFAHEFLFVRRTDARCFQFVPRFCIELAVFGGGHVLPAEQFSGEFLSRMSDHPEENIVGFGYPSGVSDDHSDDVRFNQLPESVFTGPQRVFHAMAGCDVAGKDRHAAVRVRIGLMLEPSIQGDMEVFETPRNPITKGSGAQ